MKVTFQSGAGEALLRFRQRQKHNVGHKMSQVLWLVFLLAVSGVSGFVGFQKHHIALRILVFVGIFTFSYLVIRGIEYLVQALPRYIFSRISLKNSKAPLQSVTLSREGVLHEQGDKKKLLAWNQLKTLEQDFDYFYFNFEDKQNIYLPLKAFPTREQSEFFFQTAQTLWQGTRHDLNFPK